VGGLHVSYTLFGEFLPSPTRAYALLLLVVFWCIGAMLEATVAWLTIPGNVVGSY